MNENKKTLIYAGVAVVLLILAIFTSPGRITPEAFLDQGEEFFPDFTDPNEAATLEVIDYNETTGRAQPFKVTFRGSRWTIPSHHDYPADARDRLAQTAAGVIDIKKEEFRTDKVSDHEACRVVDPLDETAGSAGRGTRVTIKGQSDQILADFIVGAPVTGRPNYRYVRLPGQNRVYSAKVDVEFSTRFEDWIETDLLRLSQPKVEEIMLANYSINEQTLRVESRDNVALKKSGVEWSIDRLGKGQQLDTMAVKNLLTSLTQLRIVGVRPKPEGLSANLRAATGQKQLTQADLMSLRDKGFYLSRDNQLLSNEGELEVFTTDGVLYTLRFGEVVYGTGLAVTAGVEDDSQQKKDESSENRYLFITTAFDENYFKEPLMPDDTSFIGKPETELTETDKRNRSLKTSHDTWARKVAAGRQMANELSDRFADWYYVISADSYDKIHLSRKDLVTTE